MTTTFNGTLAVTISDAQQQTTQRGSQQDPYCLVTLGSSGAKRFLEGSTLGKERFKTKVHTNAGQHPIWNETHEFNLKNMKLDSHLKVKLYDKDTLKDDYIGLAQIDLQELLLHDKKGVKYYPLFKKGMLGQEKAMIGQVGIGVQFNCTEIPQGHADLKSQVRDVAARKDQQIAGVAESHQQAQPTHIQGPGQMQQGYQTGTGMTGIGTGTGMTGTGMTGTGTGMTGTGTGMTGTGLTGQGTGFHQGTGTGFHQGTGTGFHQGTGTGFQQGTGTGFQQGTGTGTGFQQGTGYQQTGTVPQQGYGTTQTQQQGYCPQGQMGTQTKGTFAPQTTQGTTSSIPHQTTHHHHHHHYQ
jgi:hypothetical protein